MLKTIEKLEERIKSLEGTCREMQAELEGNEHSFNLRWEATQRGIDRWRAQNPEARELKMPDTADFVVYLLNEIKGLEARRAEDVEARQQQRKVATSCPRCMTCDWCAQHAG